MALTSKAPDLFWKENSGPNCQVKQKTLPAKDTEHVLFPRANAACPLQVCGRVRGAFGRARLCRWAFRICGSFALAARFPRAIWPHLTQVTIEQLQNHRPPRKSSLIHAESHLLFRPSFSSGEDITVCQTLCPYTNRSASIKGGLFFYLFEQGLDPSWPRGVGYVRDFPAL